MTIYTNDSGKKLNPNYVPPASVNVCSKTEWISVKERLPEDRELVVTYSTSTRRVGHCDCLKSYVELYGNYDNVTHWLPLPKLPSNT